MSATACLFCRIVQKDVPATVLYEDETVLAFKDIAPKAPFHALIIPKRHFDGLPVLRGEDEDLMGKLLGCVVRVAEETGVARSGFRVVINTGVDGGQTVSHLHLHVLGGRQMTWPPG